MIVYYGKKTPKLQNRKYIFSLLNISIAIIINNVTSVQVIGVVIVFVVMTVGLIVSVGQTVDHKVNSGLTDHGQAPGTQYPVGIGHGPEVVIDVNRSGIAKTVILRIDDPVRVLGVGPRKFLQVYVLVVVLDNRLTRRMSSPIVLDTVGVTIVGTAVIVLVPAPLGINLQVLLAIKRVGLGLLDRIVRNLPGIRIAGSGAGIFRHVNMVVVVGVVTDVKLGWFIDVFGIIVMLRYVIWREICALTVYRFDVGRITAHVVRRAGELAAGCYGTLDAVVL